MTHNEDKNQLIKTNSEQTQMLNQQMITQKQFYELYAQKAKERHERLKYSGITITHYNVFYQIIMNCINSILVTTEEISSEFKNSNKAMKNQKE